MVLATAAAKPTSGRPAAPDPFMFLVSHYLNAGLVGLVLSAPPAVDTPGLATDNWRPAGQVAPDDVGLTLRVRQALASDTMLATLQLGVSVRDRVVTLWGTVPNAELGRRVEASLRDVPGVQGVRNELREPPKNDLVNGPPSVLYARPRIPADSWSAAPAPAPAPARLPSTAQAQPVAKVSPAVAGRSVSILSPAVEENALPSAPQSTVTDRLAEAVDALRKGSDRYRRMQTEIRGDTVFLRGVVSRWEDVFELARSIGRLPGVERVVLDNIRTE